MWAVYPKRAGGNSKADAFKYWKARLNAGATAEEMYEGTVRYARYCKETDLLGTSYVMQARRFFGNGEYFRDPWEPPRKAKKSALDYNRNVKIVKERKGGFRI